MKIKNWHGGKVALLWAVGTAIDFVLARIIDVLVPPVANPPIATLVVVLVAAALVVIVPVTLIVITWKWLGGRERRG